MQDAFFPVIHGDADRVRVRIVLEEDTVTRLEAEVAAPSTSLCGTVPGHVEALSRVIQVRITSLITQEVSRSEL